MMLSNFNKPRPRWAAATSKLLRLVCMSVAAACYTMDSPTGILITTVGGGVADYILDLFPNENE